MGKIDHRKLKTGNRETSKVVRVKCEDGVSQVVKVMGISGRVLDMLDGRNHQVLLMSLGVGLEE